MVRLLTPIGLALMTAQAFAQVQVPKSYSDGEVIYADELNTNLKAIADAVPPRDCATDQIIKWDGSAWVCTDMPADGAPGADGADGAEGVAAGLNCTTDQSIVYRGGAWVCSSPSLHQQLINGQGGFAVLCPAGKKVTGGGCTYSASGLDDCTDLMSRPRSDLSGWDCGAYDALYSAGRCEVEMVYAICQ